MRRLRNGAIIAMVSAGYFLMGVAGVGALMLLGWVAERI